jgi:chromosome segregation ATPase
MDQELIVFLETHFSQISQQISSLREETAQRFEQVDQRFEQVDQRFEQVDQRFEQVDQRFEQVDQRFEQVAERFEQIDQRFEQVDTAIRHTHVSIEGLRREVCIVAEGVMGLDERLKPARKDYLQDFEDIRALIRTTYSNLDTRTHALESWRQRTERDPIELIRERFGKTPDKSSG